MDRTALELLTAICEAASRPIAPLGVAPYCTVPADLIKQARALLASLETDTHVTLSELEAQHAASVRAERARRLTLDELDPPFGWDKVDGGATP
jgi:hypothetical protein